MNDKIIIKGAREHNLKNINISLPKDSLVVISGLSGSGKSSLAFDTIFAEGQRRYVESLSANARQFLGRLEKPDVDSIEGYHLQLQSSRNLHIRTHVQLLVLLLRSMTTIVFYGPVVDMYIVPPAVVRYQRCPLTRS